MKKELDYEGITLATYQARLFEESLAFTQSSSPIFIRRAMKSNLFERLDEGNSALLSLETKEGFEGLENEYGPSEYGTIRFSKAELHWIGWIYRYIAYTRCVSSRRLYSLIKPSHLREVYFSYHTQDEEWVLANLLESLGLKESDLDPNEAYKQSLRERYFSQDNLVD